MHLLALLTWCGAGAKQVAPATTLPCNRFPCAATLPTWRVGAWGPCSAAGGPVGTCVLATGMQTRTVDCVTPAGALLPDDVCSLHANKPVEGEPCASGTACACQSAADCPGSRWACDAATHTCVCGPSWAGTLCDVHLLSGSEQCADGVIDMDGHCCAGFVDTVTGKCCQGSQEVDAEGRCCASRVDACGVCGGSGVAVDVQGTCCSTALPPSGVCCVGATLDSCGVCGGLNQCR